MPRSQPTPRRRRPRRPAIPASTILGGPGEEISSADIRVAARAELYAEANLRKYLSSVRGKMKDTHRGETIRALADVMRSDDDISVLEVDFFNRTAEALDVSPAQVAGLV